MVSITVDVPGHGSFTADARLVDGMAALKRSALIADIRQVCGHDYFGDGRPRLDNPRSHTFIPTVALRVMCASFDK